MLRAETKASDWPVGGACIAGSMFNGRKLLNERFYTCIVPHRFVRKNPMVERSLSSRGFHNSLHARIVPKTPSTNNEQCVRSSSCVVILAAATTNNRVYVQLNKPFLKRQTTITMAYEIVYKKFMTAASGWYKRSVAKELNVYGALRWC